MLPVSRRGSKELQSLYFLLQNLHPPGQVSSGALSILLTKLADLGFTKPPLLKAGEGRPALSVDKPKMIKSNPKSLVR